MKKSVKYKKVDDWYYTSTKRNVRHRIKKIRNKVIRRIDREKIEEELYVNN